MSPAPPTPASRPTKPTVVGGAVCSHLHWLTGGKIGGESSRAAQTEAYKGGLTLRAPGKSGTALDVRRKV
jgi:hypothetical protein